jgi:hypothetical protein
VLVASLFRRRRESDDETCSEDDGELGTGDEPHELCS